MKTPRAAEAIRATYDPEADALALRLLPAVKSARTQELAPDFYADFDRRGRLIAIEVLYASRHYPRAVLASLDSGVEYLTLREAAKESGLSAGTLRNQILAGRLPALKRGRDWMVAGHELLTYLENRAPQGRRANGERGSVSRRRKRLTAARE